MPSARGGGIAEKRQHLIGQKRLFEERCETERLQRGKKNHRDACQLDLESINELCRRMQWPKHKGASLDVLRDAAGDSPGVPTNEQQRAILRVADQLQVAMRFDSIGIMFFLVGARQNLQPSTKA